MPVEPAQNRQSTASLAELWAILASRRRLAGSILGGLLLLCLVYCLIVPNQYEATARVALRTGPASSLTMEGAEPLAAASILSTPLQLETLANILRSDQLAWRVIVDLKLFDAPAFSGRFSRRFPGYRPDAGAPAADAYLLERFQKHLYVQTLPRTLLIQIRFRSKDPALSAAVVNALIRAYGQQESESRVQATVAATGWLGGQLKDLKARVEGDDERLAAFQRDHGIITSREMLANGQSGESMHSATLLEIDELSRELVSATADRILREAEYRAASLGDPELVIAANPQLQAEGGGYATALLSQIRARRSDLEQEEAQLSLEHGPNFPREVEIHRQLQELDRQTRAEDVKLADRFKRAWQTAVDREQIVHRNLDERSAEGLKLNEATTQYAVMRQEANASRELYSRVLSRIAEAGLAAGVHASNITVVDFARQPVKPVTPDIPLYLAITLFVGLWVAIGCVLLIHGLQSRSGKTVAALLLAVLLCGLARAQAPTPSTSGLPSGVAHLPAAPAARPAPEAGAAAPAWDAQTQAGLPAQGSMAALLPMPAPIGPGDSLEVSEFHTPEFHSVVRVSAAGTVTLPLLNEVQVGGLDEPGAAKAIEAALVAKGMLLHPQVAVLVTFHAGQDVSVLGEVVRPGVYPFTVHHRLLDVISVASGLAPAAGRLVNIFRRDDPRTPHPVALDPGATDTSGDHNPELSPGDTVVVSRAGLVYVIGDVVRPGGFPVDPVQGLTVVQALSLAWGPSPNAAGGKAILIREQKGGRTLTTLNLRHMLRGQEPDQPIRDRDILFVPDSAARSLLNRSLEAAIQSAVGVTIYAGLVYSQRF